MQQPETLERSTYLAKARIYNGTKLRGPAPAKEPRKLNWEAHVCDGVVRRLRVQLVASVPRPSRAGEAMLCCPTCAVIVWADGGEQSSELAICRARICTRVSDDILHLNWLSRQQERPQDVDVEDWHVLPELCVSGTEQLGEDPKTIAQGIMGLSAAIGKLLGARSIELNPEDNGSGKLVRFYKKSGFQSVPQPHKLMDPLMRAPIDVVANLAPAGWLQLIVPTTFTGQKWLWDWDVVDEGSNQ